MPYSRLSADDQAMRMRHDAFTEVLAKSQHFVMSLLLANA